MLAIREWSAMKCGRCGRPGGFRHVPEEDRDVTWPDGTVVRVRQVRCLNCGATEAVRAAWEDKHSKDKRQPGAAMPRDGMNFIATEPE